MTELEYDEVDRLIRNCKTYNFGMWAADKLAHEVAPALLARVRELEDQEGQAMKIATALARAHAFMTEDGLSIANAALKLAAPPCVDERDAALSTIAKVEALHQPFEWSFGYGPVTSCKGCADQGVSQENASWPCPTIRALGSVPSTGEGNDGE